MTVKTRPYDLKYHVTHLGHPQARGPAGTMLTLQVLVHEYMLSVIFEKLAQANKAIDAAFKNGYAWGLHEAMRLLGFSDSQLDGFFQEACHWADANCPAVVAGARCKTGCVECASIRLPCHCGVNTYQRKHLATCPATFNLCLCNEPGSPNARKGQHAAWCPAADQFEEAADD